MCITIQSFVKISQTVLEISRFYHFKMAAVSHIEFWLYSFHITCPYHRNLFCSSTENMSCNPSLSLNPLLGTLSCSLMPHIHLNILNSHLCPLKCHLIFLSYGPPVVSKLPFLWRKGSAWHAASRCQSNGTSMQHTTSHTTAVQSPCHYQWYVLIGKQRYQLPEFVPSNSNSCLTYHTRSSAYNSLGKATLNSLDKASMTVTNSKVLNAEPWCILTFTTKPLLLP